MQTKREVIALGHPRGPRGAIYYLLLSKYFIM